ncbi:hypothetical protein [Lihuaxuella thermophila]|uniref:Uncharacterized protein n=1 Tax=Lihuaxuella thermophila TaxID=1173111 RepID=A0A1H8FBZ9_9BACL|nr:hypothetical protein [Lihuaxuella thermophila]SEN29282.1 hypothetical protein SAMN05444955_108123 [Lihuaxuella thermophila]
MFSFTNRKNWRAIIFFLLFACLSNYIVYQIIKPEQKSVHVNLVTDLSDQRKLAGLSHHIFVGKVISQAGTKSLGSLPETQFKVQVLQNIKGNLSGTIVVNQQGGYAPGSQLVLVEGDPLLQPGKTYLFATRYLKQENWHTVIPNYGDILLDSPVKQQNLLTQMKQAVEEQILFRANN